MMINRVIQEDETGCGIACVAMLSKRPYAQVKSLANELNIDVSNTELYTDTAYVRQLLEVHKVKADATEQPFESWDTLPEKCLLALRISEEENAEGWHWTVFERVFGLKKVYDPAPYINALFRTDFDNMHPLWFIEIQA